MGRAGNFLHESVSGCNVWEYGRLDWQMDLGPVSLRFFVGQAQDAAGGCAWSRVA
jgi:hypothetical protein